MAASNESLFYGLLGGVITVQAVGGWLKKFCSDFCVVFRSFLDFPGGGVLSKWNAFFYCTTTL